MCITARLMMHGELHREKMTGSNRTIATLWQTFINRLRKLGLQMQSSFAVKMNKQNIIVNIYFWEFMEFSRLSWNFWFCFSIFFRKSFGSFRCWLSSFVRTSGHVPLKPAHWSFSAISMYTWEFFSVLLKSPMHSPQRSTTIWSSSSDHFTRFAVDLLLAFY